MHKAPIVRLDTKKKIQFEIHSNALSNNESCGTVSKMQYNLRTFDSLSVVQLVDDGVCV